MVVTGSGCALCIVRLHLCSVLIVIHQRAVFFFSTLVDRIVRLWSLNDSIISWITFHLKSTKSATAAAVHPSITVQSSHLSHREEEEWRKRIIWVRRLTVCLYSPTRSSFAWQLWWAPVVELSPTIGPQPSADACNLFSISISRLRLSCIKIFSIYSVFTPIFTRRRQHQPRHHKSIVRVWIITALATTPTAMEEQDSSTLLAALIG